MSEKERKRGRRGLVLSEDEKTKLMLSYESLVIGKTDCSQWGLMLVKFMHPMQGRYSVGQMESSVSYYLKQIYGDEVDGVNRGLVDYQQLAKQFIFD